MSVKVLNNQNFESEIIQGNGVSLVDFYADWCGPCKMMAPLIEKIAAERPDVTVGKLNVDESSDIAATFNIMSIPTLVVFRDGKEASRIVGFVSKEKILAELG